MSAFVIKKVNTGIMFNLKADNGEIIAASEGYKAKESCENGIQSVRENAPHRRAGRPDHRRLRHRKVPEI